MPWAGGLPIDHSEHPLKYTAVRDSSTDHPTCLSPGLRAASDLHNSLICSPCLAGCWPIFSQRRFTCYISCTCFSEELDLHRIDVLASLLQGNTSEKHSSGSSFAQSNDSSIACPVSMLSCPSCPPCSSAGWSLCPQVSSALRETTRLQDATYYEEA